MISYQHTLWNSQKAVQESEPSSNILTPQEAIGNICVKRDDLFEVAGVRGGKARTCWHLAQNSTGLVTASSRHSPQANIVAHIAQELGISCHIHTSCGELFPELLSARKCGAEIIQHKPGYNSVIIARAREDAIKNGFTNIPFGMECWEAINQTSKQARNLILGIRRIVIPVGSGMSLAGVLWGLKDSYRQIPVTGIVVGADPTKRLNKYAPSDWQTITTLIKSPFKYHESAPRELTHWRLQNLDPIYEAKCVPFLQPGDLFWIVGIRESAIKKEVGL